MATDRGKGSMIGTRLDDLDDPKLWSLRSPHSWARAIDSGTSWPTAAPRSTRTEKRA
jgi:hypothetical protein